MLPAQRSPSPCRSSTDGGGTHQLHLLFLVGVVGFFWFSFLGTPLSCSTSRQDGYLCNSEGNNWLINCTSPPRSRAFELSSLRASEQVLRFYVSILTRAPVATTHTAYDDDGDTAASATDDNRRSRTSSTRASSRRRETWTWFSSTRA